MALSPVATTYLNASDRWLVIVGVNPAQFEADADFLVVQNAAGVVYDGFELEVFGAAASEILVGLFRRMMVPPNYTISATNNLSMFVISCRTMDLALAIR